MPAGKTVAAGVPCKQLPLKQRDVQEPLPVSRSSEPNSSTERLLLALQSEIPTSMCEASVRRLTSALHAQAKISYNIIYVRGQRISKVGNQGESRVGSRVNMTALRMLSRPRYLCAWLRLQYHPTVISQYRTAAQYAPDLDPLHHVAAPLSSQTYELCLINIPECVYWICSKVPAPCRKDSIYDLEFAKATLKARSSEFLKLRKLSGPRQRAGGYSKLSTPLLLRKNLPLQRLCGHASKRSAS